MDYCDELIPEWLNFVTGVVGSKDLPLIIFGEGLQQKMLRASKKNLVKQCLEMCAEISEKMNGHMQFCFGNRWKLGIHEDSISRIKNAELWRFNSSSKPGDEQIVDHPVPQAVTLTPQGRLQNCTVGQIVVDVPVPQMHDDIVEVVRLIPRETCVRVYRGTDRGGARSTQIVAEIVGLVKSRAY